MYVLVYVCMRATQLVLFHPFDGLKRNKEHVQWVRKRQLEKLPHRGDAVRIIDPEHNAFGEYR